MSQSYLRVHARVCQEDLRLELFEKHEVDHLLRQLAIALSVLLSFKTN